MDERGVASGPLFFEDFVPGRVFATSTALVSEAEVIAFAASYDPQPFHTDPESGPGSFFGRHVASGWHTVSLTMRLMVEALPISGGLVGAGVDAIRWPRPVVPGEELHAQVEVESARPSASRRGIGIVGIKVTTFNQDGDVVQVMHPRIVVPLRDAA
jgi:acyl dehydratase